MIAFDIDGVVADIMAPIRGNCKSVFGKPYNIDLETTYDMHEALGCEPYQVAKYVDDCVRDYRNIPIEPYAEKLTTMLYKEYGRTIHFITHRHRDDVGDATYKLIEQFIKVPYTISFAGGTRYQHHNKALYIPEGFSFVEDRRQTALGLAASGITVYLYKTRYNTLVPSQKTNNIVPISSLEELYNEIM